VTIVEMPDCSKNRIKSQVFDHGISNDSLTRFGSCKRVKEFDQTPGIVDNKIHG